MTTLQNQIVWPKTGHYIVAVSGGSDSMALLHLLAAQAKSKNYQLDAAHFNHGWPGDDHYELTVHKAMERYDLPLHVGRGTVKRTEAAARTARYKYLRQLKEEVGASAIIAAHHRDDLEETVVLNLLRGTGRRGLTPFARTTDVLRPLRGIRKKDLRDYAESHNLIWCHDTYNDDLKFRRNQVRRELLPELRTRNKGFEHDLTKLLERAALLNDRIDEELENFFSVTGQQATAKLEAVRPMDVDTLGELIVAMARSVRPGIELMRRTVAAVAVDIKTSRIKRRRKLASSLFIEVARDTVQIGFIP